MSNVSACSVSCMEHALRPTFKVHSTVRLTFSSAISPRLASSARARQTPCHRDSPRTDSEPPKPITSPALLPPGSTMVPKGVSMTGSSSVPANRSRVPETICSRKSTGKVAVIRARYLAAEYRTIVS